MHFLFFLICRTKKEEHSTFYKSDNLEDLRFRLSIAQSKFLLGYASFYLHTVNQFIYF